MESMIDIAGGLLEWTQLQSNLPDMIFFQEINSFLDDEIGEFAVNLLERVAGILGVVVLSILTFWILVQGYRIVTGQSREPMMALVTNSLKAVLIIGIATGAAAGADSIYNAVTNGLTDVVNYAVTGDSDGDGPYEDIDTTLAIMQVALGVIDSVDAGDDVITNDTKDRSLWFAGFGLGGPAIMAGTMLLLNKIAMALIVGLGPLFILCLLFEQTKQLFTRWLFYGIGTLFSLAMLTVMVTLALDMVIAVGMAFWASSMIPIPGTGDPESLMSMAMQQGGLGLILTMLIVSAPPMAAMFFNGVLGHFSPYSAFSQQQRIPPGQPGAGTPVPNAVPAMGRSSDPNSETRNSTSPAMTGAYTSSYPAYSDSIKKGSHSPGGA